MAQLLVYGNVQAEEIIPGYDFRPPTKPFSTMNISLSDEFVNDYPIYIPIAQIPHDFPGWVMQEAKRLGFNVID